MEEIFEEELDDLCETTYTKDESTLRILLLSDAMRCAYDCYDNGADYLFELLEMNEGNVWDMFLSSGLFHDAIGKVIDENENEVTVTTEY